MGSMSDDYFLKNQGITPSRARYKSVFAEIGDYEYVDCDDLPDLNHGLIWAHRIDHIISRPFEEIVIRYRYAIEQARLKREAAAARLDERMKARGAELRKRLAEDNYEGDILI